MPKIEYKPEGKLIAILTHDRKGNLVIESPEGVKLSFVGFRKPDDLNLSYELCLKDK